MLDLLSIRCRFEPKCACFSNDDDDESSGGEDEHEQDILGEEEDEGKELCIQVHSVVVVHHVTIVGNGYG